LLHFDKCLRKTSDVRKAIFNNLKIECLAKARKMSGMRLTMIGL